MRRIFMCPSRGSRSRSTRSPAIDALERFNANFLEPQAGRAALTARVKADANLTSTGKGRIDRLLRRAQRLREFYGVRIAGQRAPFFEVQTSDSLWSRLIQEFGAPS